MAQLEWNASPSDKALISRIAARAMKTAKKLDIQHDRSKQDFMMDVEAVHNNDMKLDLKKLLAADDFNFIHDVFGIGRHLNRETGKLQDHFLPRARQR